ncbi:ABC-F family ATP-binding cassette domain-containing protein [Furfurilactobacillus entadae]|uniref:ABC-F family ATP-binding cassette domain-containing protein n=1 Tax=Furfurilactobacillus entadae TaxID=2922307 RepID=UPI0035E5F389
MFSLQATNLSITRQQHVLFTIPQLIINPGDRIGLVGANGAGKTTLIGLLTGTVSLTTGTIDRRIDPVVVPQLHHDDTKSGGEQTKMAILTALHQHPQWLILDEPSANLDVNNQTWLIQQLQRFSGTLLLISHDQHLLDAVTTSTWQLADETVTPFAGKLSAMQTMQAAQRDHQAAAYKTYRKRQHKLAVAARKREERAAKITKPNPHNHSANELQDIKSALRNNQGKMAKTARVLSQRGDDLAPVAKPKTAAHTTLRATQFATLGRHVPVRIEKLRLTIGSTTLSDSLSLTVRPGQRVAITGPNGCGKTTLLRAIMAHEQPAIHVNDAVSFGYFAQDISTLIPTDSVWTTVRARSSQPDATLRTILAEFGFSAGMLDQPTASLSGGQRVKLSLVAVLTSEANVLVLDEPTNYLDLPTLQALTTFLSEYPGTVLFVSHDQQFVQSVATNIYDLTPHGLVDPTHAVARQKPRSSATRQAENDALLASFRHLD